MSKKEIERAITRGRERERQKESETERWSEPQRGSTLYPAKESGGISWYGDEERARTLGDLDVQRRADQRHEGGVEVDRVVIGNR